MVHLKEILKIMHRDLFFFSRGILEACKSLGFRPDIIHCNDWQTGLVPLYLKTLYMNDNFFRDTATLFTIHNIGYQGLFPASDLTLTNFGWDLFTPEGIEFYGRINFLKAGLISAEILNTVSYTYSREILTQEYGFGLEGVLKRRIADLYGIINGIDYQEWNPSDDRFIPASYTQSDLRGKNICKLELFKSLFNFSKRLSMKIPLIGVVGRLSDQKGIELIINSIEELMTFDTALIILGKGDEIFQRKLIEISRKFKEKVSVTIGYNEQLAHKIYAGIDFFFNAIEI